MRAWWAPPIDAYVPRHNGVGTSHWRWLLVALAFVACWYDSEETVSDEWRLKYAVIRRTGTRVGSW